MSRRRHRRRRGAMWLAAVLLVACWQLSAPLRWLALGGSAAGLAIVPLALAGSVHALPQLLTPRRVRMARRKDQPRPPVPKWLRLAVYAADRWRCVFCGSKLQLQLDHIVPWSFGGLTSLWNCATLCSRCNRVKSNYYKADSGQVYYRAWRDAADKSTAGRILRRELLVRYSLLRWVRAGCTWWFPNLGR